MPSKTENEQVTPLHPSAQSWPRIAAKVFVGVVVGVLLYVAHAAFIPVALALLLALILSGPVELLHKRRVPRGASAALILLIALVIIGTATAILWKPTQEWFAKAPQTIMTVKQKMGPIARLMNRVGDLTRNASDLSAAKGSAKAAPAVAVAADSAPLLLLDASGSIIAGVLTFIIVTLFLLAGGPPISSHDRGIR